MHRLDFGFLHLPHTRQDWFRMKLHNPRIFDRDRARGWEEKLRMPNFRFSGRELDQVVTAVLGFQQLNAAASVVKELNPREAAIERGRRIVKDHNCQGCHVIEGVRIRSPSFIGIFSSSTTVYAPLPLIMNLKAEKLCR